MTESNDDIGRLVEEVLARAEEALAERKQRRENPYVINLIEVLWPYPSGLARRTAIDRVERLRQSKNLPIPKKFDETVQNAFNHHTSQSTTFQKRAAGLEEDLFYSPDGKGSGTWALHRGRAESWLKTRREASRGDP